MKDESLGTRFKNAWNAFFNKDPTIEYRDYGPGYSYRPDRPGFTRGNERSIVTSIYNRIALDVASINIRHVRVDENGGYDISEEDYKTMQKNTYKVFGIGVLPAVGLSVALATYPGWEWLGSCYGMSTVVFLNHYGMINALERDQNAKSVSELKNDTDIISMINYYQWSAAGSFLCENFALKQGSKMYSQQLKDVYESVADGNIVLFTFYSGEMFKTSGHTVLFTGAYTQADGTKVLVAYDSNYGKEYCAEEYEQRFYIDKDFTTIKRATQYPVDRYMDIGAFNWTDDYKHFEAFDINGGGRVFTWYSHYFSQLGRLLKTWISLIKL